MDTKINSCVPSYQFKQYDFYLYRYHLGMGKNQTVMWLAAFFDNFKSLDFI